MTNGIDFAITGPYGARAVIVHGAAGVDDNLYLYPAIFFPHGIGSDTGLQASDAGPVSSVDVCVTAAPYNAGA
ncbi:hypothetical protein AB0N17_44980 [Streptomyces sp. NPDC051133]|uniref:hypothetical protein n=1 Tax=Streptomyces sp. NPDC051133 TaxID=3155521 RepID=UPI0034241B7C